MAEFLLVQKPEAAASKINLGCANKNTAVKINQSISHQSSNELSNWFKLDGRTRRFKGSKVNYLPIGAVFKPVADLVLGLEEIVFESRWSSPTYGQLIVQIAHAAHVYVGRRIRRHWTEDEKNSESLFLTKEPFRVFFF